MTQRYENGSVGHINRTRDYRIDDKPGVKASVKTDSGDTCTMQAQGQFVIIHEDYESNESKASILPKQGAGFSVSNNDGNNHNSSNGASVGDSLLEKINSYNPAALLVEALNGTPQSNTKKSVQIVADAMKNSGITCTDPTGKPSSPVLSIKDIKHLADKVVGPVR
jgi:hypothetical protein